MAEESLLCRFVLAFNQNSMMRIVVFAWLVFLYYLSMAPFEVKSHFRTMGHMHNLGHVLAFLITTLLLAWNCRTILSCCCAAAWCLASRWGSSGWNSSATITPMSGATCSSME